jgi:hypothetical protein
MPVFKTRGHPGLLAVLGVALGVLALGVVFGPARGAGDEPEPGPGEPAVIRDGFETARTVWNQEQTDATINLLAHDRSTRAAHEGKAAEHFRFNSGLGSGFFFSYPLPKVPVTDALRASLYVRANRAGVQLFARVVLPADIDPATNQPSFLLVPGTIYEHGERWQRLEVVDLGPSLERQARVLRASTRRVVSLEGAYVEQLVVNLFTGVGETEVFLDELSVGPVPAALVEAAAGADVPAAGDEAGEPAKDAGGRAGVILPRNRLKRRGEDKLYHDWVFTAIHAPGADIASLRKAGFDVLIDDITADPKRLGDAVANGFLLMPRVGRGGDTDGGQDGDGAGRNGAGLPDPDRVVKAMAGFPFRDSVMAWDLGDHLGRHADPAARKAELESVRATLSMMRGLPPGVSRLATGIVEDDVRLYGGSSRGLDMLGFRPPAWGSAINPMDTYFFLRQRRNLTVRGNTGALSWALLPATPTPAVALNVWGHDVPPAWGAPVVQPEQLRWMTYAALSAGYRGLAFHGDADLTRGPGRMLLLEMTLLNAEIDLCEWILANGSDPIPFYSAFDPDPPAFPPNLAIGQRPPKKPELKPLGLIRGAAINTRDRKGVLLLVADYAPTTQFQPQQAAKNDMTMTVIAPEGAQAFEISPGRVRVLERKRDIGGTRIFIPEFDTSALILVTTDIAMAERVEAVVNSIRPRAVMLAIEQAELKLQWVTDLNGRLAADGHYLIEEKERKKRRDNGGPIVTDTADLLAKATENIKAARENAERLDWENAWSEARRASRPLRVLMSGLWNNAEEALQRANTPAQDIANEEKIKLNRVKPVGPPRIVPAYASVPLVSFGTLPQHYVWVDWMKSGHFGRNLIPSGTFDDPDELKRAGWDNVSYRYDGIKTEVTTVPDGNRKVLRLKVFPAERGGIDELTPFLDFAAAAVRSPAVAVSAGQFLRISVMVRRTVPSAEGIGGVVVRDSIGGEALQFVSAESIPKYSKVILYRRAPDDGELTVTLGLAGYGEILFDDLKVERVEAAPAFELPDVARLPRRPAAERPSR